MLQTFGRVGCPAERQDVRRRLAVSGMLCLCVFEDLHRVRLGLPIILFTGLEGQDLGELNGNATEEAIYAIDATNIS
jgi:hypothetical protein